MTHEFLFNHVSGSSKKLRTSPAFERYEKNQKGKIISDVIDDLIYDEDTVRPLKSLTITANGETRLKLFKATEVEPISISLSLSISKRDYIKKVLNELGQKKTKKWETVLLFN